MKEDIYEMNEFLKGLYMGIHTYEYYIQHCEDAAVKKKHCRIFKKSIN